MYVNFSLENEALMPAVKRTLVDYLRERFMFSVRTSCRLLGSSRTVYWYNPIHIGMTR